MDNSVFVLTLPVIGQIGFVNWAQVIAVLGIVLVHTPAILLGITFPIFVVGEWWRDKSWKNFLDILFSPMYSFVFLIPILGLIFSLPFVESLRFKGGDWLEKIAVSNATIGSLLFFYGFVAQLVMLAL